MMEAKKVDPYAKQRAFFQKKYGKGTPAAKKAMANWIKLQQRKKKKSGLKQKMVKMKVEGQLK